MVMSCEFFLNFFNNLHCLLNFEVEPTIQQENNFVCLYKSNIQKSVELMLS
jgi:hypothetical protein